LKIGKCIGSPGLALRRRDGLNEMWNDLLSLLAEQRYV
jgi:hypothetical protein